MRQLSIEERLARVEENVVAIRHLLERMSHWQEFPSAGDDACHIMSVKQLARFLGLDTNLIYARCAKGDIPYFRVGKQYRFKKAEILRWVKSQKELPHFSVDEYVDRYLQENQLKG